MSHEPVAEPGGVGKEWRTWYLKSKGKSRSSNKQTGQFQKGQNDTKKGGKRGKTPGSGKR